MISIRVTGTNEILARLDQVPKRLRKAVTEKFNVLMTELAEKAIAQFPKSVGADEFTYGVDQVGGSLLSGYVETLTAKAGAIESGGKGYYEIVPSKATLLSFIGAFDGKRIAVPYVFHPPMVGKQYILQMMINEARNIAAELSNVRF